MAKKIQVGARIDPADYQQLISLAHDAGQTKSELIAEAIGRYLGGKGSGGRAQSKLAQLSSQVRQLEGAVARLEAMVRPGA